MIWPSSVLALRAQLLVLALDLELLELAQTAQTHVEDRLGLHVGQLEGLHQDGLRLVLGADDADDLVEVEIGDEVAVEHLKAVADLVEAEFRCAGCSTSRRCASHSVITSREAHDLAALRAFSRTLRLSGIRVSSSVSLNSNSISSSASTVRERGSITSRMSSANSSRTSAARQPLLV